MEAVGRTALSVPRALSRVDLPAVGAWLFPFLIILYLAFNNGGYDTVERSEAGLVSGWVLLIGILAGALAVPGRTRAGRVALLVLGAFAAWTALSLTWTDSSERTMIEVGRVLTYLTLFTLALAVQSGGRARYLLNGATAAVAVVCAFAVLSRLEPESFPASPLGEFFPGLASRLSYPLNYTSGLGGFAAIALPLLLAATAHARTIPMQALAAGALPLAALTLWLTASGLSVPVAALAVLLFLALASDRIPKVATLLVAGAGSAILFAAVVQRDALDAGLRGGLAQSQGDELLTIALVVCAGVALVQAGISLAVRYGTRPRWLMITRRQAQVGVAAGAAAILLAATAAVATGAASDAWDRFTRETSTGGGAERTSQILDYSSNGRYTFWRSAVDASETASWTGIGAGTFEFWWAKERPADSELGFVRDAHSLYFETLAELGIVGLLLIGGFSVGVLAVGARRAVRAAGATRLRLAAATAGCLGFIGSAAIDWMWELAVLPAIFVFLAAVAVEGDGQPAARRPAANRGWRRPAAIAVAVVAVAGVVVNGILLASNSALESSQAEANAGDLGGALERSRDAAAVEPYAGAPLLQEAVILEEQGQLDAAVSAASEATRNEPENWRTWLTLSRLEAKRGNAEAAVAAYREARGLNPGSGIFTTTSEGSQ